MTVGKFIVQPSNSSQEKNLIKLKRLDMQQTKAKETRRNIHIPKSLLREPALLVLTLLAHNMIS